MTRSGAYALVQTALLVLFNAVFFLVPGAPMFDGWLTRRVGTALSAAGLLVVLTAVVTLRRVIQVQPAPKSGGHLVVAGLYRWLRHPIYTGMAALVIGLFLRRPTPGVAAAGIAVIGFLLAKARFEESLLRAAYPEYDDYRSRTRGVLLRRGGAAPTRGST